MWLTALALAGGMGFPVAAADLTIGLARPITTADPQFHNQAGNNTLARHVFEMLLQVDHRQALVPGLAVSWRSVSGVLWEFKLREGVRFHNGSPFTADDVVYSINRASRLPRSPAPFTRYVAAIAGMEVVDSTTIHFRTDSPHPLLPNDLSRVAILSRSAAEGKTTQMLNEQENVVGTGPYRFGGWQDGRVVLHRNGDYWGEPGPWDTVILQSIPDDKKRLDTLTSGKAQLVEHIPPAEYNRLTKLKNIALFHGISERLILLQADVEREKSPFVEVRRANPLRNVQVREAISMAIDRKALAEKTLDGLAYPAWQLLPDGFFGTDPSLKHPPPNTRQAKNLIRKAGYPRGFGLTLHAPADPILDSPKVAQAVAAMLEKAGIKTQVETMPRVVFFPRAAQQQFSLMMMPWRSPTGETSASLSALLATNEGQGTGLSNHGRFSNPRLDSLLQRAMTTVDDARREELLRDAQKIGLTKFGVIPLLFAANTWAAQKGINYTPRTDGLSLAMNARPAP